jgi:hypothetical protein
MTPSWIEVIILSELLATTLAPAAGKLLVSSTMNVLNVDISSYIIKGTLWGVRGRGGEDKKLRE